MPNHGSLMPSSRILNSWKEIATYLGRGVRTIQRYEEKLGLPVHRPFGRDRTSVMAFADELDLWLRGCPTKQTSYAAASDESARRYQESDLDRAKREMEEAYAEYQSALDRYRALERARGSDGLDKRD